VLLIGVGEWIRRYQQRLYPHISPLSLYLSL
jgi:hypothetical protein